jgi:hypothetical protein
MKHSTSPNVVTGAAILGGIILLVALVVVSGLDIALPRG